MTLPSVIRPARTLVLLCLACSAAADDAPHAGYRHYVIGNPADVIRPTSGLIVLQGGGDDVDENYIRMGARSGGGDFVVLRASGEDDYNEYIYALCGCDSVDDTRLSTPHRCRRRVRHGNHPQCRGALHRWRRSVPLRALLERDPGRRTRSTSSQPSRRLSAARAQGWPSSASSRIRPWARRA